MFHLSNDGGLDPASPPAVLLSVYPYIKEKYPTAYLLVQACQHLWLVASDDVYQQFTFVDHTTKPSVYPR
jgi:hypothetical protein